MYLPVEKNRNYLLFAPPTTTQNGGKKIIEYCQLKESIFTEPHGLFRGRHFRFPTEVLMQYFIEELARDRFFYASNLFRGAGCDDSASAGTPFRAEVNDMVGAFNDIQVVFYNHYGVPHIDQSQENIQQFLDIRRVETYGRLIKDIEGVAVASLSQFS
jgi:hypothetical protein